MSYLITAIAILTGALGGLLAGICFMRDNINYISKQSFANGYDLGKSETLKRYGINEQDNIRDRV